MPVMPQEEDAPSNLTEKVAKDPSSATESTASDHERHHNEHNPGSGINAFQSKGPQIPMNMSDMPPKASKEELRERAKELNQE